MVDDDQGLRNIMRLALEEVGYCCSEAGIVQEARDVLLTCQPTNLLITDHQMPMMTGLELVKWVRSYYRLSQMPILFYSGKLRSDLRRQALEAGATAIFSKPFLFQDLLTLVAQLIPPALDGPTTYPLR